MIWSSLSQIVSPLSQLSNVDSLVDQEHFTYNYELPLENSISFTFDVSSNVAAPSDINLETMSDSQKGDVRGALSYISNVTGISFTEVDGKTSSGIVFGYYSSRPNNAGVDYFEYNDGLDEWGKVVKLTLNDTVLLNSNNMEQIDPAPGTDGYATILHEVGHALGLKHPFEGSPTLPKEYDNESFTIMSYTPAPSGVHPTTYGPVDLASLSWLYGGDGLRGAYGLTVNSQGVPVASAPVDFGDPLGGLAANSATLSAIQSATLIPPVSVAQPLDWLGAAFTSGANIFSSLGDSLLANPYANSAAASQYLSSGGGASSAASDLLQKNQSGFLANS